MIKYSADKIKSYTVGSGILLVVVSLLYELVTTFGIVQLKSICLLLTCILIMSLAWIVLTIAVCITFCFIGVKKRSGVLKYSKLQKAGFADGVNMEECKDTQVWYYKIPTIGIFVEGICCD